MSPRPLKPAYWRIVPHGPYGDVYHRHFDNRRTAEGHLFSLAKRRAYEVAAFTRAGKRIPEDRLA